MISIQKDVLEYFEKIIRTVNLIPRISFSFNNTGIIYGQKEFKTFIEIFFNFQDTYVSFKVTRYIDNYVKEFPYVVYAKNLDKHLKEIELIICQNLELFEKHKLILTETTVREIVRIIDEFKNEDVESIEIASNYSDITFTVDVENIPNTQESLGYKCIKVNKKEK